MAVSQKQRDRCIRIRDKARELFGRPNVGNCESLAQLIEWAFDEFEDVYFGTFNNDEETFVEDFGLVLTERSEWVIFDRSEDQDLYLGFVSDSCFSWVYTDGSNQVRHFWGYVMMGFQYGQRATTLATLREALPPEPEDAALGVVGNYIGSGLDGGLAYIPGTPFLTLEYGVSLKTVPKLIRAMLCKGENCFESSNESNENEEAEEGD